MSRVIATSLVLVNWKGVFYERYALDRHVTALEGDNGAGKTTVMIAAYVVLLPDMARLRFTNLGETGATGGDKGIWGRLGEPGRPAYAAMEFVVPGGERVVAGVHLERKGEPTVEPTPFLITGLRADVRLQEVLLVAVGEQEGVPELTELRDNVARLGGRLERFVSAKEYFAALFERDITPMRLGTDEERNKLNEMLRTSMTGGMSKGLLQDLRSFLLKEETSLADTLTRMRSNLDACRRTRGEVKDAQQLEREIGGVYEAGEEMFAAAVAATRQRAEEQQRRVAEREAAARAAAAQADARAAEHEEAAAALDRAEEAKRAAAAEVGEAGAWEARVADAWRWSRELAARSAALARAEEARGEAELARSGAERALERAAREVGQSSDRYDRAAAGLADLQRGLEELHRRAGAHRAVRQRLADARVALETPALGHDGAEAAAEEADRDRAAVDAERRELGRRADDADAHRAEHAEATRALEAVVQAPVAVEDTLEAARGALSLARGWRDLAARRPALAEAAQAAAKEAARQAATRAEAARLGVAWAHGAGRAAVVDAADAAGVALAAAEAEGRAAAAAAAEAARAQAAARAAARSLEVRAAAWRSLDAAAQSLTAVVGAPVVDRAGLDAARGALGARREAARAEVVRLTARRDACVDEARQLRQEGGAFSPELLQLRDALTADLLASHFDDVGVEQAADLEARLGPLVTALVVPDVEAAARQIVGRGEGAATVWLVAEDAPLQLDPDGRQGRDVWVREREALRVTRAPGRPTLGRSARARRADELEREAASLEAAAEAVRADERAATAALRQADMLLEGAAAWALGDGAAELDAARRALAAGEADQAAAEADQAAAGAAVGQLGPRLKALRALLPDAALLDGPDRAALAASARAELEAADEAATALARVGDAPAVLERRVDALRRAPWSAADVAAARGRLQALDARRDRLAEGADALRYVAEHREALAWTDAAGQLAAKQGLVPALEAQLADARASRDAARVREGEGRAACAATQASYNEADAAYTTARSRRDEATRELAERAVDAPSEALLAEARARSARSRAAVAAAEVQVGAGQREVGARASEARSAREAADRAVQEAAEEEASARPLVEVWERLEPQVAAAGLAGLTARFEAAFGAKGSVNVWQIATTSRARLVERLRTARGGAEVLAEVDRFVATSEQRSGEGYLQAWLVVRDWLRARLPAQIAEVDDPLEALSRFRDHLAGLEVRLAGQERALRGASEDVARGIDVQLRKAQGRVRRLNEHLERVAFGSVRGVRVRMQRVEKMEAVLRALRSGEAQELLFQAGMPIEEAMEEIFRRYAGGRAAGQRLLDYREYLHLQVEVLRAGGADWEVANPTRLSTGEAIGVGAALMMVVLTEWEHDARLLRGRRAHGSMRFLFLDEANRLDQANLGTVFDLCRNLDLQLLVAAPEVARAEGCTVFRLVRSRGEGGAEAVLVSGRRVARDAE